MISATVSFSTQPRTQKIQRSPLLFSLTLHGLVAVTLLFTLGHHSARVIPALSIELVDSGPAAPLAEKHAASAVRSARKQPAQSSIEATPQKNEVPEPAQTLAQTHNPASTDGAGGAGTVQESTGTVLQRYLSQMMRQLNQAKIYPEDSIFRGEQGRVVVEVEVFPDGRIGKSQVLQSSLFESLDHAAIDTIFRIGKFAPLPIEVSHALKFRIPILFELSKT